MKVHRISADSERLAAIAEMATLLAENNDGPKYSMGIEFALAELVRDEMRLLAQSERRRPSGIDLLRVAVDQVMGRVDETLRAKKTKLDFRKYIATVRDKLAYPAKEMQELGEKLADSRGTHKLGMKEELVADSGSHFVVHELGLRDAIQGLLVEPARDRNELNVDILREQPQWRMDGEWFPYEVFAEDFVFVIDDDGSIFVSTANLPPEVKDHAGRLLKKIAVLLYT